MYHGSEHQLEPKMVLKQKSPYLKKPVLPETNKKIIYSTENIQM